MSLTLGKDACEMALIGKAAGKGDVGKLRVGFLQELFSPLDAPLRKPSMGRHPHGLLECACEVAARKSAFARELRYRGVAVQIGVDKLPGRANLPWREACSHPLMGDRYTAIDVNDVIA